MRARGSTLNAGALGPLGAGSVGDVPQVAGPEEEVASKGERMATMKKETGIEWVGGVAVMPGYVTGEGEPYRPEALLWLDDNQLVLGVTTEKPGALLSRASDSLAETMAKPMVGKADAPSSVRVATKELAEALRAGHPNLEIVIAPTPEVDAVMAVMREHMGDHPEEEQTYLGPDLTPKLMASFFRSAATLYRARPWAHIPANRSVFSLNIEQFGLREAALVVIGQMGESLGFILFANLDDYALYHEAASTLERDEDMKLPHHFALNFERGADLSPALRKEVSTHRWEVAGPEAYPWPVAVDPDLVARPPTAKEVAISEAVCLSLPQLLTQEKALDAAWKGEGPPVSSSVKVSTHAGDIEVSLRAPHEQVIEHPPFDLMADLFELGMQGEVDSEARADLEEELLHRFEDSPEAQSLAEVGFAPLFMDYAADYFTATIATLDAHELREIVFSIVPRKVSIEAAAASGIIDELRAFYAFLKREFGLKQADACLRELGGDAVKKLATALSDKGNFGMAKSFFMAGAAAGFDMSNQKGIEAWMQQVSSKPLPDSFPLPFGVPARPATRADASTMKKQRKAAKKARRRNR
ncbi:MAG: hypothetical protein HY906_23820 [Deltaproteobacteria bacterium]|nr:hypothetical protein [Deltaproteobacteria bacterium]